MVNVIKNLFGEEQQSLPSLTPKERIALALLIARGPLFGVELVENSGGELKRGTIYVLLDRMEDKGFIKSAEVMSDPRALPRRQYEITGLGERTVKAWDTAQMVWKGANYAR